ncbi:putative isomerase, partial [Drosera capensis]
DPVCGSAHCALALYWSKRLNKHDFVAYAASPRSGVVKLLLDEKNNRVKLQGKAITVMEGFELCGGYFIVCSTASGCYRETEHFLYWRQLKHCIWTLDCQSKYNMRMHGAIRWPRRSFTFISSAVIQGTTANSTFSLFDVEN